MSGRGKSAKSMELIAAASRILEEIQPATVRAVCYRLFVEKLIPSMEKTNTNRVSTQLVWAREQGIIPWDSIVDETREAETVSTWKDPQAYMRAVLRSYRRDFWTTQPERIEVWSEKGTVRGTLANLLEQYAVTFRVMHGFGSATTLHSAADDSMCDERTLTVLYVGDWDPSGMYMSEVDLPERLVERYEGDIEIVRVALNEQDTQSGLPYFDAKASDTRYDWYVERYGHLCWEFDALSPVILRERVEEAILERLDQDAWDQAEQVQRAERESMTKFFKTWNGISGRASK
jgi:hypothetical protein